MKVIIEEVRRCLGKDPRTKCLKVRVKEESGNIVVTGNVGSYYEKQLVNVVTMAVDEEFQMENLVKVIPSKFTLPSADV